MNFEIGTLYHGIKLLAYCGGGAYGEVYYGEEISGRKVAVKIISKSKLGDSWQRELKGVSNYCKITENAPQLLQIYHVEEDADTFYYTMEAADNAGSAENYQADTLAGRLQNGALPADQLLPIIKDIFAGIKTIHEAGFTHRDIKPDNILFVNGIPKLADIGLLSSQSVTVTMLAGTLEFIPPELRSSDSFDSSDRASRQRSDLYAFGKVIYCMTTGSEPQDFPSLPADFTPTLLHKLLMQFVIRLCHRHKEFRIASIVETEVELQHLEHTLLCGETWKDRLHYRMKSCVLFFSFLGSRIRVWSEQHYLLTALIVLILAVGGFFVVRALLLMPNPEAETLVNVINERKKVIEKPSNVQTFKFHNGRYSVNVPATWMLQPKESFLEQLLRRKIKKDSPSWLAGSLRKQHRSKIAFILPRETGTGENTLISMFYIPRTKSELEKMDSQQLATELRPFFNHKITDFSVDYYKKTRSGYPAAIVLGKLSPDLSFTAYVFPQQDHSVVFTMELPRQYEKSDDIQFLLMMETFRCYNTTPALKGGLR